MCGTNRQKKTECESFFHSFMSRQTFFALSGQQIVIVGSSDAIDTRACFIFNYSLYSTILFLHLMLFKFIAEGCFKHANFD